MKFLVIILLLVPNLARSSNLDELRFKARLALRRNYCSRCHTPGLSTSKTAALQVYDLSRDDWYVTMSDKRLEKAAERLSENLTSAEAKVFQREIKTPVRPIPARDVAIFKTFVEQEIKNRHPGKSSK